MSVKPPEEGPRQLLKAFGSQQSEEMDFTTDIAGREQDIVDLFSATFTASEGAEEGKRIADLVRKLLDGTPEQDRLVFIAVLAGEVIGAIVFSRLVYLEDDRTVFILSPVAVAPEHQGQGHGQKLLQSGLEALRNAHVDVVVTYGDPNYYSKVGFHQITEAFAKAPFNLSHPEGWLAQSLSSTELEPLKGSAQCARALNDPVYW